MTEDRRANGQRWLRHISGGAITLLCLVVFFRQINFSDVVGAFANFQWSYLILGLASLAIGYALRIIRWSMMLRAAGARATFASCSAPFLGSIALNNALPLRLGDVVRALVFPMSMGITKTAATSSLIVERLIDLITLLAGLAIGLLAVQAIAIPAALKASAISLAAISGAVLVLGFLCSGPLSRFFTRLSADSERPAGGALTQIYATVGGLLRDFDMMLRPRLLFSVLAISMLVWVGEAGLFYFVLLGAGIDGSPLVALFVMAVATLSTLVPSSPGYIGPFHLAAFAGISLVGGTAAQAGSYAVIVHLALWLPTTLVGVLAIWTRPELFRAARSQAA